jgi:hypothetical protein
LGGDQVPGSSLFFIFPYGGGKMGQVEHAAGEENSITDIRKFFEGPGQRPLEPHEFVSFWQSLSEEDKIEFKQADLTQG